MEILNGVVSKDHVNRYISYPPKLSISDIINRLKVRYGKLLHQEYPVVQ